VIKRNSNAYFLSSDKEDNTFILRILLSSLVTLTFFAFIFNVIKFFTVKNYHGLYPGTTAIFLLFFCFLLFLSRKGRSTLVSYFFLAILFSINLYVSFHYGPDLPVSLLLYCLIIILTGILLSSRKAFLVSVLSAFVILFMSYCEIAGLCHTENKWKYEIIHMTDAIVYALTLGIISLVSWLSNREIQKSLQRARRSEAELQRQRDILEETVEKRTAQLKQAEGERIAQLYHFIEFGKLAGGLFHDLVTPLNLISLNLENINEESKSKISQINKTTNIKKYLRRAMYGTKRLETFIAIARKQIQESEQLHHFFLSAEIDHVVKLFRYNTNLAKVIIQYKKTREIEYYGNPLKFNQIVTNLISNALDSFEDIKKTKKKKIIHVELYKKRGKIYLIVSDNGAGMDRKDIKKIFDPLFTTKEKNTHMGLGLYLIKEIVQKDFNGTILVKSKLFEGTTFSISFPFNQIQP